MFTKKVVHDLKNPNLTQNDIDKIKNYVLDFSDQMTKNPNLVTKQDQIISNLNNMLIERKKQLGFVNKNNVDSRTSVHLYRHPKADELNKLESKKRMAKQNNDVLLYQQLQNEIENVIRNNRAQVNPKQWDKMSNEERKSFMQIKRQEAKILKDEDEFNYWNANLNNLNLNDKDQQLSNSVSVQDNHIQNANNDNLDFSIVIEELRNESNKVQEKFRSMMYDGNIDDEELTILISINSDIIKAGYSLKECATDINDLRKFDVIISNLEEQQKKMSTMLIGMESIGRIMK